MYASISGSASPRVVTHPVVADADADMGAVMVDSTGTQADPQPGTMYESPGFGDVPGLTESLADSVKRTAVRDDGGMSVFDLDDFAEQHASRAVAGQLTPTQQAAYDKAVFAIDHLPKAQVKQLEQRIDAAHPLAGRAGAVLLHAATADDIRALGVLPDTVVDAMAQHLTGPELAYSYDEIAASVRANRPEQPAVGLTLAQADTLHAAYRTAGADEALATSLVDDLSESDFSASEIQDAATFITSDAGVRAVSYLRTAAEPERTSMLLGEALGVGNGDSDLFGNGGAPAAEANPALSTQDAASLREQLVRRGVNSDMADEVTSRLQHAPRLRAQDYQDIAAYVQTPRGGRDLAAATLANALMLDGVTGDTSNPAFTPALKRRFEAAFVGTALNTELAMQTVAGLKHATGVTSAQYEQILGHVEDAAPASGSAGSVRAEGHEADRSGASELTGTNAMIGIGLAAGAVGGLAAVALKGVSNRSRVRATARQVAGMSNDPAVKAAARQLRTGGITAGQRAEARATVRQAARTLADTAAAHGERGVARGLRSGARELSALHPVSAGNVLRWATTGATTPEIEAVSGRAMRGLLRASGPVLLGAAAAIGAAEITSSVRHDGGFGRMTGLTVTDVAASLAGGLGGAAVGARIGTRMLPGGALAGGFAGAVVGSGAVSLATSLVASKVTSGG
jgi:hypothetical protein